MGTKTDRLIGLGLFFLGLFTYVWVIPHYVDRPAFEMSELPADMYPKIIVGALTALGLVLLLQSLWSKGETGRKKMPAENKKRAVVIITTLIAFLFAIDFFGYYFSTAVFLSGMIMFLGERRVSAVSLSVILFLAANYLFFEQGLKLTLPRGLIARILF